MEFNLTKASDWEFKKEIEINTLEELLEFHQKVKNNLIIEETYGFKGETPKNKYTIMIYDSYIE